MFEKILFPTDFSKYSQKILECVKELPGVSDVVLLHVIGPSDPLSRVWDPGGRIDEFKTMLAEQSKILDGRGLNVKTRIEPIMEGDVSRMIQRVADEEESSVIVMGARGKGVVEGILLGNVAKNVLRYGSTNLLLMRYRILEGRSGPSLEKFCLHPFSKVLCPTDLSKPAEHAIAFIKGVQGVEEVVLQHVVSRGETWEEIEAKTEEITKRLNVIREGLEAAGITGNIYTSAGNPAEEIIALAEKEDVSMIAMSSHGMDWLKQLGVGSTTYDVAWMGDRPVLVVRAGTECLK
ncbi:MAG TPA: universal stress protein [Methanothrix sp.]|nr:universal stress protein [Methanothrix sp.]